MEYLIVKWLHIVSSTVLFGTGLGSAYYIFFAGRTRKPAAVGRGGAPRGVRGLHDDQHCVSALERPVHVAPAATAGDHAVGPVSFALYFLAGACLPPVVCIQIRMRRLANAAVNNAQPLPVLYFKNLRW